jgi:hypothetical protein
MMMMMMICSKQVAKFTTSNSKHLHKTVYDTPHHYYFNYTVINLDVAVMSTNVSHPAPVTH